MSACGDPHGCSCGCCEGTARSTPVPIVNPPGLDALSWRAGTHASFLESMKARLSASELPALAGLTTRDPSDPAIALLDAWAMVADVLTFYQERIANEGYLRTATERRSVLELARLVGYEPRPGVAASVSAAFAVDAGAEAEVPAGTRIQSLPAPGELPQTFETAESLHARGAWNELPVRLTRPQEFSVRDAGEIYVRGVTTRLEVNDALLFDGGTCRELHRVLEVEIEAEAGRTRLMIEPWLSVVVPSARETVLEAMDRFCDPDRSPSPESQMTGEVHALLGRLQDDIEAEELTDSELRRRLESHLLPQLQRLDRRAAERGYTLLAPWTGQIVAEMVAAAQALPAAAVANPKRRDPRPPGLLDALAMPASIPPRGRAHLSRSVGQAFAAGSGLAPRLLSVARPELVGSLYPALANLPVTRPPAVRVYALRLRAAVFGHNAPLAPVRVDGIVTGSTEWTLEKTVVTRTDPVILRTGLRQVPTESARQVWLDAAHPQVLPGSWIALVRPVGNGRIPRLVIARASAVDERSRAEYGMTARATLVELDTEWLHPPVASGEQGDTIDDVGPFDGFDVVRGTAVFAHSELLELAEAPIDPVLEPVAGDTVELATLVDGLEPGRWLTITGERTDLVVRDPDSAGKDDRGVEERVRVPGVPATELAMLAGIEQVYDDDLPGDRVHTRLRLANALAYSYRRDTVVVHGNVARATHGETGGEVLGSGDAARALQRFVLRRAPLTWVSARTPSGIEGTLEVRVDGALWRRAGSLAELGPADRAVFVRTGDDGRTSVVFGNGEHGARPATGVENVTAVYRAGIGKAGNVAAGRISLLADRPLGVVGVVNPLPASGGADPETRDQARRNAPLAVMALDRPVSVADYADFARTFAGVGKASATRLTDGRVALVHVTVAGVDDEPILESSDLYRNLREALGAFGDPRLPVRLAVREAALVILSARVRVVPELLWEDVEPGLRARLVDHLGFDRRELAQDVLFSEVVAAMQAVRGVDFVDVDVLWRVDPEALDLSGLVDGGKTAGRATDPWPVPPPERLLAETARVERCSGRTILRPAQILYLSPAAADTLILQEIPR